MSSSDNCKIKVSMAEGILEISGNENFVKKQIKNFKDYIEEMLDTAILNYEEEDWDLDLAPSSDFIFDDEDDYEDEDYYEEGNIDGYLEENVMEDDIFDLNDEDILVIGEIPGESTEDKTVNAALLYTYARELQGASEADVKQIKKLLKMQGFYDKKNFEKHLNKGIKKLFNYTDADEKSAIKLYKRGREKVTKLIEDIKVS